jgi:hypothetical protein
MAGQLSNLAKPTLIAEEVFAGINKTFAETVPLTRHGTPEDLTGRK